MGELTKEMVRALVEPFPLHVRMRWYASLNSWQIPADFPVQPQDYGQDGDQHNHPTWRAIWNGGSESLTNAQASLAWWLFSSLQETPTAWADWWRGRSSPDADETVQQYLASLREAKEPA